MICSHCGGEVEDNSEFCPHCGEPFHEHEELEVALRRKTRKQTSGEPHGNFLKILVGVAVVLAVVLLLVLVLPRLLHKNQPEVVTTTIVAGVTTQPITTLTEASSTASIDNKAESLNGDWNGYFAFDTADGSNPEMQATLTLTATGVDQISVKISPVAGYKDGVDADLALFLNDEVQATYQDDVLTFAYTPFADAQPVTFRLPVQPRSYGYLAEGDGESTEFQLSRLSMTLRK